MQGFYVVQFEFMMWLTILSVVSLIGYIFMAIRGPEDKVFNNPIVTTDTAMNIKRETYLRETGNRMIIQEYPMLKENQNSIKFRH